ncbi:prolyl-tRNA synthetase [Candidatus Magnetobacterium bavaricum]|uniref:Proline--tRNA ligase n=1 Tax=Candidatus Magnetobacterium bavaricum TaxID=29290 RepID=A0A0F3GZZ6_9BACT|nr:prolyl-tRNA synthetase [Candidatus Magnetobacterium bavaricum]
MRYSKTLIPTLKEMPSDAEAISHVLLLRGGYVRQLASGLYIYLPLFWRVLNRINNIIRQELNRIGAQELSMPVLHPAEVWQKTGRWYEIKEEMFRLKDRTGRDMCLAMTHEEIMTWLASREIRSYRDMPQVWYQIQTKVRDEARPKSGVLRTREFIMKDSYSFDVDDEGLQKNYDLHIEAYDRIFSRCGLTFYRVESDPGMMGGATAHEYMAPSLAGEDEVAICGSCGYAANVELAVSVSAVHRYEETPQQEVLTPQKRTVEEVTRFMGLGAESFIKSLLLISDTAPVLALIRGDQVLHEKKVNRIIGNFRPAHKDEVKAILGVEAGFIGPMGHKLRIIADNAISAGVYVSGANKVDHHVKGIRPGVDFQAEWHDIHLAKAGDGCPHCGGSLRVEQVIEIGNIFKLGTKYSAALNAVYLNKDGVEVPIVMGSYGIGPARIAAAAIEQHHDINGMVWPESIAPFDVEIIPLNVNDAQTMSVSEKLYAGLTGRSFEVLLDDRDERAGVKFKDADLIGIPFQIVLGPKSLKDGLVEVKRRKTGHTEKHTIEHVLEKLHFGER